MCETDLVDMAWSPHRRKWRQVPRSKSRQGRQFFKQSSHIVLIVGNDAAIASGIHFLDHFIIVTPTADMMIGA